MFALSMGNEGFSVTHAHWCRIVVAILAVSWFSTPALASSASAERIETGYEALVAGREAEALAAFDEAVAADPADSEAHFYRGLTLNRLGRFDEADAALQQAARRGYPSDELLFERGWAAMGRENWRQAIDLLQRYERAAPGRGQTAEFLGRSYLGLGNTDKARQWLNEAVDRQPDLQPTVELYLMSAAAEEGEAAEAAARLRRLSGFTGDSPVTDALRRYLPDQADVVLTPDEKRWRLRVTVGGGWNDNVLAVADGLALPGDVTSRDAWFARIGVAGAYDLLVGERDRLVVGYGLDTLFHEQELNDADLIDQQWYALYQRRLSDRWTASVQLADDYTIIGGDSFRNQISLRPAVQARLSPYFSAELSYRAAFSEYYFDTTAVLDRDSDTHSFGLTFNYDLPKTQLSTQAGLQYTINNADGDDFDFNSTAVFISLSHPLVFQVDATVGWTHVFQDYRNDNSLTGFTAERDDDVDIISVSLTRPVDLGLRDARAQVYLRFDHVINQSNIPVFDYDQSVIAAGVMVDF